MINKYMCCIQYLSILLGLLVPGDRILPVPQQHDDRKAIELRISNVKTASGQMMVAVYNDAGHFLTNNVVKAVIVPVHAKGEMSIVLRNMDAGEYAISLFHDVNGNGELDTNFLGIPNEPYGFLNNARGRFGPPKYSDAMFSLTSHHQVLHIALR